MAAARSSSPSAETAATISSGTPFVFRSWRIFAAPYLRDRIWARISAKRWLERSFLPSNSLKRTSRSCWEAANGKSLRCSSARECSRRARYLSARALRAAALSRSDVLNLLVFDFRLGGLRRGAGGAGLLADLALDLARQRRVFLQEVARVVLALAEPVAVVDVPGARLLQHAVQHADLQHLALARDAVAVEDVELGVPERRRHLVLHHLDAGLGADHLVALLDRADAADVHAHRGVELERVAAGGGLGVAEHDTDLHADLVDEDHQRVGALDVAGELAQRLAHQARLQAHLRLAHLARDLGLGGERRHGVDDDHVDRAGAHQHVGDLERLLAGVGLGDEQVFGLDAELGGVGDVERVLRVDEGGGAADLLHLGDDLEGQGRLARGLRTVDLDHPAARQAADAEGEVQAERARGHHVDIPDRRVVHLHDRALAELLLDLGKRGS